MSEHRNRNDEIGLRLEIDPEPTPEELVAILEVVRSLGETTDPSDRGPVEHLSNWTEIARREALRPAEWPPQRGEWSTFRR